MPFPQLGCGHGELDWETLVKPVMERYLRSLPIPVYVHLYHGPDRVQTTTLEDLNLKPKQEFMYLVAVVDEWRFRIRVYTVNPDAPEGDYPRIVESVGESPEQYPSWE